MASSNGRLPMSALASIGNGYYLEKSAAAAFNAMSAEAVRRWGRPIRVISGYRTYDKQVYLWNNVAHARDPNWVAVPGTSNHGWGLAIDLASQWDRWAVDQIGAKYGFAKRWSDAPIEWWHIKYRAGVWSKPQPDPLAHMLKKERAVIEEWQRLKKARTNKKRRGELFRWMIQQRKNIYRAAQKDGWKKLNRRKRYSTLYKITNP